MEPARGQITALLQRWSQGDADALNLLIPLVYEDLRRLANYYLQQETNAQTLGKDIASVLQTTEATVRRDWNIARAWLYRRLQGEGEAVS